jgi:hypothetical protein
MKALDGVEKKTADVLNHNNVTDEDENFIFSDRGVYSSLCATVCLKAFSSSGFQQCFAVMIMVKSRASECEIVMSELIAMTD